MIKVLIVDPDPCELYRACEIIAGLGVDDLLCASTFEDAMSCLQEQPVLIVADADSIPRSKTNPEPVSGDVLIHSIKKSCRGVIIIGQTVGMRGSKLFSSLRSGADDVVEKRALPSRLLEKVPIWLSVAEHARAVDQMAVGHVR